MKNSVPILQTLRSGRNCQQGNSRMGNSLRASFLASVPFCFLRIRPFLSARPPLPTEESPSSRAFHHLMALNLLCLSMKTVPMTPAEGTPVPAWLPPALTPAEFSTSRFLPSCSFTRCFPPEPARCPDQGAALLPSVHSPLGTLGSHSGLCWSPHLSF